MKEYQKHLYHDYASLFRPQGDLFDHTAANKRATALKYFLRAWLPQDPNARILDLGCGAGGNLYLLKKFGYTNLSGVDWSESQVGLARQICSDVECRNVLDYLVESRAEVDLIISFDLIEHLSKDEALLFLRECYRNLKLGGRLVLQTPNAASPFFGQVRYGDMTHEIAFTPRLLEGIAKKAGFSKISTRETGPVPTGHSAKSTLRSVAWAGLRQALALADRIETGAAAGIYTRVFLLSGLKS